MNLKPEPVLIHIKNRLLFTIIMLSLTIVPIMIYLFVNNFNNHNVINSTTITQRLSNISELSTIKYSYCNVIALKNSNRYKDFYIPFTEKSFLIKYSGYIKAGVDLKDLDVVVNGKKITITLKKAKILDNVVNDKDFFVYDEKSSMFNKLSMQDMINEISNEKKKLEIDLLKTGFLDGANANSKLLMQGILSDMGFETVTIIFK